MSCICAGASYPVSDRKLRWEATDDACHQLDSRSKHETCTEVKLEFVVAVKVVLKITWRRGQQLEQSFCTSPIQTGEAFMARTTFKTCNSKTVYIDLAILVSYQGLFNK